jgi:hypothetical protein
VISYSDLRFQLSSETDNVDFATVSRFRKFFREQISPSRKDGRLKPLRQHPKHVRGRAPAKRRAAILNPNHRIQPKAITHPARLDFNSLPHRKHSNNEPTLEVILPFGSSKPRGQLKSLAPFTFQMSGGGGKRRAAYLLSS